MTEPAPTVRLDRAGEPPLEVTRAELLDLYRVVIDEYRFQARLNWDRTQYFFVLNTAITTTAGTLLATLKAGGAIVAVFVFLIGMTAAVLGRAAVITGHEYYRRVIYRKTILEDLLGRLHPLPGYPYEEAGLNLATTQGMAKSRQILEDPQKYFATPLRFGTITHSFRAVLWAFLIVDACGVGVALYLLGR